MSRVLAALALAMPLLTGCVMRSGCDANDECATRKAEPLRPGLASRQGDTLTLSLSTAAPLTFTDSKENCDPNGCRHFVLMGVFPKSHAFVVQLFHYEGSDVFLIDSDTGRRTELNGMPVFSPDGAEFLVAPFDDENDTGPDNLQIWRRQGDSAVLEWAHPFKQAYMEDPALPGLYQTRVVRWQGNTITLALATEGPTIRHWSASLVRDAQGWHLSAKSPPGLFSKRG